MHLPPLVALFAWVAVNLILFRRFTPRVALLIDFVGGWAILPAANYIPSPNPNPYWFIGTSLESDYFVTKATVIGFTALLTVFLFDRPSFRRFRLTLWDLPMGMWLLAPLFSSIANPDNFGEGCVGTIYQFLAWGSPYLIGRLYFTDTQSLRIAAKAFVIAGLAYIPFCLFEFFRGPSIYVFIYGYQPFQTIGARRFLGFRPVGLLENGNQLGIWMATSALIALWLWRRKAAQEVLGIPIAIVAIALVAITILCQSTGAIILLVLLAPFVFIDPRHLSRTASVALVVGILAFAAFRLAKVISVRDLVKQDPTAHAVASTLKAAGKSSFEGRLNLDDAHIDYALQEPILGYGQWNWWQTGFERPASLWLLVFGMYGSVGLISLEAVLLIPALRAVWFPLTRSDIGYTNMRHTLSAAVLISAIDSLLNSTVILPLLIVVGGMGLWSANDTSVDPDPPTPRITYRNPGWRQGPADRRNQSR